jgi:hypothetical protein
VIKITPEERFLSRINKTDSCWLWIGTKRHQNGYGCLEVDGKLVSAHRFSWLLYHGNIPNDLFVLHKCDNKICVNPDHLFLGTQDENNKDRARKNRSWRGIGELSPAHKLTLEEVRNIRKDYNSGFYSQRELARKYKVVQWTIGKIVNRITWKDA